MPTPLSSEPSGVLVLSSLQALDSPGFLSQAIGSRVARESGCCIARAPVVHLATQARAPTARANDPLKSASLSYLPHLHRILKRRSLLGTSHWDRRDLGPGSLRDPKWRRISDYGVILRFLALCNSIEYTPIPMAITGIAGNRAFQHGFSASFSRGPPRPPPKRNGSALKITTTKRQDYLDPLLLYVDIDEAYPSPGSLLVT
ncbi:hypothetical protein B0H19DRAFT_1253210 [Mycena capillaripes]|nr:hypothetical protein B0H19DRAFT_1253210 [Mycena capillaripes]